MQNRMLDEFIADYAGIKAAIGSYRADWFLRFIGLENSGDYRAGGRMTNYLGEPPLSHGAFRILQQVIRLAAHHLETFDRTSEHSHDLYAAIRTIAGLSLEELASEEALERLQALP